jgi:hypothetical protein
MRFFSGSSIPSSAARNSAPASTTTSLMPMCFWKVRSTLSRSSFRSSPLSTKTQVRRSPMAGARASPPRRSPRPRTARRSRRTPRRLVGHGLHGLLDEGPRGPGRVAPADAEDEVGEDLVAAHRVRDLRMELDAVDGAVPARIAATGSVLVDASARIPGAARRRGRRGNTRRSSRPRRSRRRARRPVHEMRSSARPYSRCPAAPSPPSGP